MLLNKSKNQAYSTKLTWTNYLKHIQYKTNTQFFYLEFENFFKKVIFSNFEVNYFLLGAK